MDQDKPAKVALSLDAWDKEQEHADPFVFVHHGKRFEVLNDPGEIDWPKLVTAQRAVAEGNPAQFIILLMGEDGYKDFVTAGPCGPRKLGALIDAIQRHYGMVGPGE